MESGASVRQVRRKGRWHHHYSPMCTCTMSLISGPSGGDGGKQQATSLSCARRMTSWWAFSTKPTRGASGTRCVGGLSSSRLRSIWTRPACGSLAAMPRRAVRGTGSGSRRPSCSWALSSSAANPDEALSSFSGRPEETACGQSFRRSRRSYVSACTNPSPTKAGSSSPW